MWNRIKTKEEELRKKSEYLKCFKLLFSLSSFITLKMLFFKFTNREREKKKKRKSII